MTNSFRVPRSQALQIEYDIAILRRLEAEVAQSQELAGDTTVEVGGLLLGSYSNDRVRIAGFEPFTRDQSATPAFILTALECHNLANRIHHVDARHRSTGCRVVGWYHSQAESRLAPSAEDLALHDELFPEPWQVILLLHANPRGTGEKDFFLREGSASAIPVRLAGLQPEPDAYQSDRPVLPRTTQRPKSTPTPAVRFVDVQKRGHDPSSVKRMRGWGVWAGLACLAALSIAGVVYLRVHYSPNPGSASGGLVRVEALQRGSGVEVSWDTSALTGASHGQIDVQDGNRYSQFPLSQTALLSGHFTFTDKSDVTGFRLHVDKPDGSILEGSTTFVAPPASRSQPTELAVSKAVEPAPTSPETQDYSERMLIQPVAEVPSNTEKRDAETKTSKRPDSEKRKRKDEETPKPDTDKKAKELAFANIPMTVRRTVVVSDRLNTIEPPTIQAAQVLGVQVPAPAISQPQGQIQPPPPKSAVPPKPAIDLSGNWILQRGGLSRSPAVPEALTIAINANGSAIQGTLDAHYRNGSKKEHLTFSFAGSSAGATRYSWTSSEGSHGQIEFIPGGNPNTLEVVWYNTGDTKQVFDEIVHKAN